MICLAIAPGLIGRALPTNISELLTFFIPAVTGFFDDERANIFE